MSRRLSLIAVAVLALAGDAMAAGHRGDRKLDATLRDRAHTPRGSSRVIITTTTGAPADAVIASLRGKAGRRLSLLGAQVAEVPDSALEDLASLPGVKSISFDRPVRGTLERTGATIGSTWVQETLGVDGTGVGVAIIDSGVTSWHDDLASSRVVHFADFVQSMPLAYDDYGHGTHVAGIIAGSGYDSNGARKGIAPGASLVVLKVLDAAGNGYISNVIAALDYAVERRADFNVRVINLSVAAGVYESYDSDPLTLAAKRAVEAGVVVVTAAGNLGRNASGQVQYGGITAPGNAPWVLTVGASSHMGTTDRADDAMAGFSSRGPTYLDYAAKPDLVAPGVGIESLADASSLLYMTHPSARLWGTIPTATEPYLSLSGTSMAAPVVAATAALMIQANPSLTPNAVKAILQFTSETRSGVSHFAQGAGFLNARGAVEKARSWEGGKANELADESWNKHIIWGNYRMGGGDLTKDASAWRLDVAWGAALTPAGEHVTWGVVCDDNKAPCDESGASSRATNIVWGTSCADNTDGNCENIVWGTSDTENVVWGGSCDGNDCENIVWGTSCDDNDGCENIVWGTACESDGDDCENIVWGTATGVDNIVWGTPGVPDTTTRRNWRVLPALAPAPRMAMRES